jgi:hypothetical protein
MRHELTFDTQELIIRDIGKVLTALRADVSSDRQREESPGLNAQRIDDPKSTEITIRIDQRVLDRNHD